MKLSCVESIEFSWRVFSKLHLQPSMRWVELLGRGRQLAKKLVFSISQIEAAAVFSLACPKWAFRELSPSFTYEFA